jgi:hypothetical protein
LKARLAQASADAAEAQQKAEQAEFQANASAVGEKRELQLAREKAKAVAADADKTRQALASAVHAEEARQVAEAKATNQPFEIWISSAIGLVIGAAAVGAIWILLSRRRREPHIQATLLMNVQQTTTSGMPQVFVSYSRQDERAVDLLVKEIEELGHPIWIDRQSTGSQRYAGKIVEAIKKSRFVALMCSQNAFASDDVIREVYVAGGLKKPFIVFLLEPAELPNEILYFVTGFPRIAVTKMDIQTLRLEIARLVTTE